MIKKQQKHQRAFGHAKDFEKITSPDDLNNYIQVTTPKVWLLLAALLLLLLVFLIWCFTGNLLTTTKCSGIYNEGVIYAYVPIENASQLNEGLNAHNQLGENTVVGTITEVSQAPLSQSQAAKILGSQELAAAVVPSAGGVQVKIECQDTKEQLGTNVLSNVEIILSDIRPIDLFLRK